MKQATNLLSSEKGGKRSRSRYHAVSCDFAAKSTAIPLHGHVDSTGNEG